MTPPPDVRVANVTIAFLDAHPKIRDAIRGNHAAVACDEGKTLLEALGREGATVKGSDEGVFPFVAYDGKTNSIGNAAAAA